MSVKRFKVRVRYPNGREVTEARRVMNFPDVPEEKEEEHVRAMWRRERPNEEVLSIEPLRPGEHTAPPAGAFPAAGKGAKTPGTEGAR